MAPNESKRETVARLLARGLSTRKVASESGVARRTICRWLQVPAFKAMVASYRREMTDRALGVLAGGMRRAGQRLLRIVQGSDDKLALAAARAVIELAIRVQESTDMEQRLADLEEKVLKNDDQPTTFGGS